MTLSLLFAALLGQVAPHPAPDDRNRVRIEARDLRTDAPIPGVPITFHAPDGQRLLATTDAKGEAEVDFRFPRDRSFFSFTTQRDGLVPIFFRWDRSADKPQMPERVRLQMEPGSAISGRVVDDTGQPLADAAVVVSVRKRYGQPEQMVGIMGETVRTNADGRWSLPGVPEQTDAIELAACHPLCLDGQSSYHQRPFEPQAALRDGSAVLRLVRGTRVEGAVLNPEGNPVAGAEVSIGAGSGYSNALPPIRTDAEGRFALGFPPGTITSLVARSPGFGPIVQTLKVTDAPARVYLALTPAHAARGRVVDPDGKPVGNARVDLYWSGAGRTAQSVFGSAATHRTHTDNDGRFVWPDAPSSDVYADIFAGGFAGLSHQSLRPDSDNPLTLVRPTPVKGTVVDRATGQPVPAFTTTLASAWEPGDPFLWQGPLDQSDGLKTSPGAFEKTFSQPAHRYLIRVQADGYLAEDSDPFPTDGKLHALSFRLSRGEPIRGTVVDPSGSVATKGVVCIVPIHRDGWITYLDYPRETSDRRIERVEHAKIGPDGRFTLAPQRDEVDLLILTDNGSRIVAKRDLHGDDRIMVQPWARVSGRLTFDGKPAAKTLLRSFDDDSAPVAGKPRLVRSPAVETDDAGHFTLDRILPGKLTLAQITPNGVERRVQIIPRATLEVVPGQTYDLNLGGSGRAITGRLALPTDATWMVRKPTITPRGATDGRPKSPAGLEIRDGGQLRALDLAPGDYTLHVTVHEPPPLEACGWGRMLGEYRHDFTVPDGSTAADPPLDLGTLEPVRTSGKVLQAGERAPDFRVRTLDGKELKLSDLQGKFVVLDFWATWCAPCVAELANLQRIQEEFGSNPRFALVGVSLDEKRDDVASLVEARKLGWTQGVAGPEAKVVDDYGATAIPATFLIDPDGTIRTRDLRGDALRDAVAKALR